MTRAGRSSAGRRGRWVIVAIVALMVAVLAQQAAAAQLGGWLAGLWVSALEVVLGVLAPLFVGD